MLTNFNFLEVGQGWVPDVEKPRIALYELNNALYKNDHSQVLDLMLNVIYPEKTENEKVKRVFINLYRSISRLWADLLFSEDPKINASEQDFSLISDLIKINQFWKVSKKVAIDVSRYGNGLYKIRQKDNAVIIEAISPRLWFPVVNPDNINDVQAHVLAYSFIENKTNYLKVEIHRIGSIEHKLFIVKEGKIIQQLVLQDMPRFAALSDIETTGVNDFLVIPVENSMDSESAYGDDDYTDIDPLITQIEAHLTKYGRDLEQQGTLKYGPKSAIDENGNVPRDGYIGLMGGANQDQVPGAVSWNVQHESIKAYIEQLLFFFYIVSETSPAIFDPNINIGNISGVAIKRLMQRLLLKSGRLAENFDVSIKRVFKVAAELQNLPVSDFNIKWQDGLVSDLLEKANSASVAIGAGAMSKKTGVAFVQELEGASLEAEYQQVLAEGKKG